MCIAQTALAALHIRVLSRLPLLNLGLGANRLELNEADALLRALPAARIGTQHVCLSNHG